MKKFVALRSKTCRYLTGDSSENEKVKGTKKFAIKWELNLKILKTV